MYVGEMEGRKKERSKVKQTKIKEKQHITPKAVRTHNTLYSRQSALPATCIYMYIFRYMYIHTYMFVLRKYVIHVDN